MPTEVLPLWPAEVAVTVRVTDGSVSGIISGRDVLNYLSEKLLAEQI